MGFKTRNTETEWMDLPDTKKEELEQVLIDINRVNRLLNGYRCTLSAVNELIRDHPQRSYTILDMGCADGVMLREIVRYCRKSQTAIQCIGLDLNEDSLQIARANSRDYPEIRYVRQDIMSTEDADLQCDILTCTLTMHHFDNEQIPIFLKRFTELSRIGIVINDLQRSRSAYYLFKVFSTIFIRTKMARHDGGISIKSGFTKAELFAFSKAIPRAKHRIRWKWAFRYVWVIRHIRLS